MRALYDRYVVKYFVLLFSYRGWKFGDIVTHIFWWTRVVLEKREDIGRIVLFKTFAEFVIEFVVTLYSRMN